jgi:AraC-like DNA-binding protein
MVDYIYSHYSENITLDDIAASGNISRSQCAKLFNRYTSLSPINFLNKHRLEISRELLRTTYLPIGEIALSCGFSDQSYFNRLFVKQYGITPFAYRKGT